MPTTITAMPASTILPGPILSVSTPATGIVSIAPMPCGASSSPACSVVSPRTCRKYDGNSRLAPKNAMANSDIAITATVSARLRNRCRSISGCSGARNSERSTNSATSTRPIAAVTSTLVSQTVPASGIEETPYRNSARPGESSSMPTKSKLSDGVGLSLGSTSAA